MDAYALKGGLDLRTGKAQVNPGTLQDCLNYEVANVDGYTRIGGMERFDGKFRVADFRSVRLRGTLTGTLQPGDVLTFSEGDAIVTQIATTAVVVLMHSRETWPLSCPFVATGAAGSITVTGCDLLPEPLGKQADVNAARKVLADAARPLVGIVPGNPDMPVAGTFWFKNRLYAIRDYPAVWFESTQRFPFRVGDQVTMPGGVFTVIAIQYTSDAYLAGNMTVWPLRTDGTPMMALPQPGDQLTHNASGDGFVLGGAALGEMALGMISALPISDTSAEVTATQAVAPQVTDEPVMRSARTMAGLWKATSTGWQSVDLKREAQFNAGTAAFGTFITNNLGPNAAPLTSGAEFCGAATFDGTDCTAAVDADDGTEVALSGDASDELRAVTFDFSAIPDTATVLGVEVRIKRHADVGAKAKDAIVELVGLDGTSSNKARAVEWDTTSTEVVYGGATDTWGNDNLTPAILKGSSFGVRLVTQAVDATPAGGIDYIKVTVTYRRRDAAVYGWTGSADVPFNLVDAQLISGDWSTGDGAGWLVVDIPDASWGPTVGNGMQLRTAPNGAGDLLAMIASGDAPINLPGWADIEANQSRYQTLVTNFYGMADYRAVYGVSGASPAFTYDGTRLLWLRTPIDASQDLPRHIARHGSSLVLGYWPGAYLLSVVGEPTNFRGEDGAFSDEIGEHLTGLMAAMGDALLITSRKQTYVLHGLDPTTYQKDTVTGGRGAIEFTAADVGRLLVTDQLGVAAADATQQFGDLSRTYLSMMVEAWLAPRLRATLGAASNALLPITALAVGYKNQYRLFFRDGWVLTMTANEPPEFTWQRYYLPAPDANSVDQPFPLAAATTGIDSDGRERVFASFDADANRGYVFELNHGATFDGQPIPAYFILNPLSFNTNAQGGLSAMVLKRFDRMFLLGQAEGFAKLALSRTIDGDPPDGSKGFKFTFGPSAAKAGVRAVRGEVDAPIEGYEVTVRVDSNSDIEGPHTVQAISTTADSRGDSRGHVRG